MLLLVHTISVAHDDFVVNARFYHTLCSDGLGRQVQLALLGKRVAVTVRRHRRGPGHRLVYYLKCRRGRSSINAPGQSSGSQAAMPKEERGQHMPAVVAPTPPTSVALPDQSPTQDMPIYLQPLCSDASAQQTAQWLQAQRFSAHLRTFASFSGADLLRLSRDDLIQICGLPDGIRLFNALHSKSIAPRLTVYLSLETGPVYHALFLERLSFAELSSKLCNLLGLDSNQLQRVFLLGPNGAHVLVSDEVVRNLPDQALFSIQLLHDQASEQYRLLLKPAST